MLDAARLDLYREDPVAFAEEQFYVRQGQLIRLEEHQKRILRAIFTPPYPSDVVWSAPKKSGKSCISALAAVYVALVHTPEEAEVLIAANDLEQAQDRVYGDVSRALRANRAIEARVDKKAISLATGVRILPIAADSASAAGPRHSLAVFDELWAYQDADRRRMFHELTPILTLPFSMRWVSSYAGFEGKPDEQIVTGLIRQAMAGERVFDDLPVWRNGELFVYWDSGTTAWRMPWQIGPRAEGRRANERVTMPFNEYRRMHLNEITGNESAFITAELWDRCVDPTLTPLSPTKMTPVVAALDIGVKNDTTGFVGVYADLPSDEVRVAFTESWIPAPGVEVDLDAVESAIYSLHRQYAFAGVLFDPWQAKSIAQRLTNRGVPMIEFPQTTDRLTLIGQALLDLVRRVHLRTFPEPLLREHVLNAVAVESARGWRIAKDKASQKIDLAVALAMAAYGVTSVFAIVPAFDEERWERERAHIGADL